MPQKYREILNSKLKIETLVVYYCSRSRQVHARGMNWGMKGIYLVDFEIGLYTFKVCTLLTCHVVSSL